MPRPPSPTWSYRYPGPASPVDFLARPNRYLALVRPVRGGPTFEAHVPNPGRMYELLLPGSTRGWVVRAGGSERRTSYDLIAVRHAGTLVSIDSLAANRLVGATLGARPLSAAPAVIGGWRREVRWGDHRLDFGRFLRRTGRLAELLEVKSSNLREGDTALFPDAPTERGTRHLRALTRFAQAGGSARVLFVIQRDDIAEFAPHRIMDPAFAQAFDLALAAGVRMDARSLRVRPGHLAWGRPIPVRSSALAGGYKGVRDPSPKR